VVVNVNVFVILASGNCSFLLEATGENNNYYQPDKKKNPKSIMLGVEQKPIVRPQGNQQIMYKIQ
jgi:hypothetical protein